MLKLISETYKGLGLGVNGDPKGGLALGEFTNPISGISIRYCCWGRG